MHPACRIPLRHLLVNDAAACGHPLHIAGSNRAAITDAVGVVHRTGQNIGDGLDSAMRMPGESGQIVFWDIVAKVVEQQEGVEIFSVSEAKRAPKMHACAFQRGLGLR